MAADAGAAAAEVGEATASSLKEQGNALFGQGLWLKAAAAYTQAIRLEPDNAVLYSNRSAALLKLKKISKAQEDADKAISLRPEWEKGYFRRAAIYEDQENLPEALDAYLVAASKNPNNDEIAQKVKGLQKLLKKTGAKAKAAEKAPADAKATISPPAPVQPSKAAAKPAGTVQAAAPPKAAEAVYEDLGSEEVAQFTEEHLGLLAEEIREHGCDFIPMVHLLPGAAGQGCEEQDQHVRGAGAFESPQTLKGFVAFLRDKTDKLQALAAVSLVPKAAIAYPQTWTKGKWPCGGADGVFAQLESQQVQKLWFVPVEGKTVGTPQSISYDDFAPMPRLLRAAS